MKIDHAPYLVIANPFSGRKKHKEIIAMVQKAFPQLVVEISNFTGHPFNIVNEAKLKSYRAIIAIGGDGTMHEVVNGMMKRDDGLKIPIGLIPGGTGNSFMHDLKATDPLKAIDIIKQGLTKQIDLAEIKMKDDIMYAFNIIGWGMSVTINNLAERWRKLGGQRYNLAALYEITRNPKWSVNIKLDDAQEEGEYSFFLACNTMYSGNGMKVAPLAKLDDGLIDVLLLKQAPRAKLIAIFSKIFSGKHIENPLIDYRQVSSFSIIPKKDSVLNVDGQITGTTPIQVKMLNQAIEVFYPQY